MLKIRSFNQLDDYLEYYDFKRLVPKKMRLPRIDAIRNSLKCFCLKSLQAMHNAIIRCSIQNKLVQNSTIDGYKVVAIDGIETFESINKSCGYAMFQLYQKVYQCYMKFLPKSWYTFYITLRFFSTNKCTSTEKAKAIPLALIYLR